MWCPDAALFDASWEQLKASGEDALARGESEFDVSQWPQASSAHLAVMLYWWQSAKTHGKTLTIHGLNPTFLTLAELGGVQFLYTGATDAGH